MISNAARDYLRRLSVEADKHPWKATKHGDDQTECWFVEKASGAPGQIFRTPASLQGAANAKFAVAAREHVPKLLDSLDEKDVEIARLRQKLRDIATLMTSMIKEIDET